MKVGNPVRRKLNPITLLPQILGLVTEVERFGIRVSFLDPERNAHHGNHWLSADHFEVIS